MPWWIWLILALFMLGMLVAGIVYAAVHAMRGLSSLSEVGGRIGERVAAMGEPSNESGADFTPTFTMPLTEAADRYADAHAGVIERRERRRERHIEQWAQWGRSDD